MIVRIIAASWPVSTQQSISPEAEEYVMALPSSRWNFPERTG